MTPNKIFLVLLLVLCFTWEITEPEFVHPAIEFTPEAVVIEPEVHLQDVDFEEIDCLAQNIYFEARGESKMGQLAVGLVTLNRVKIKRFPDTVCEVVWQKKQFSWTHDGKSDKPKNKQAWADIYQFAYNIYSNYDMIVDITRGSTHYHAIYVNPNWSKQLILQIQIDKHLFYSL